MPGLVPGIHVLRHRGASLERSRWRRVVHARNKSTAVRFSRSGALRRRAATSPSPLVSPRPCAGVQGNGTVLARLPPDRRPGQAWTPAQGRGTAGETTEDAGASKSVSRVERSSGTPLVPTLFARSARIKTDSSGLVPGIHRLQHSCMSGNRRGFSAAYRDFVETVDLAELDLDPDELFEGVRDRTPGRSLP